MACLKNPLYFLYHNFDLLSHNFDFIQGVRGVLKSIKSW